MLKYVLMISVYASFLDAASSSSSSSSVSEPRLEIQKTFRTALRDQNDIRKQAQRSGRFPKRTSPVLAEDLNNIDPRLVEALSQSKSGELDNVPMVQMYMDAVYGPKYHVTAVRTLGGGFVSGDIYRVTVTKKAATSQGPSQKYFFIKYLRKRGPIVSRERTYREMFNMTQIQSTFKLMTGSYDESHPHHNPAQNIKIIIPDHTNKYTITKRGFRGSNAEEKTFMIMPSANGKSLSGIVEDNKTKSPGMIARMRGRSSSPPQANALNVAFGAVGRDFAAFQRHYAVTPTGQPAKNVAEVSNTKVYVHGDFHGSNVFYDDATDRVSLIDTETLADSFGPDGAPKGFIGYDFGYLLLMSDRHFGEKTMSQINWAPFKSFLANYISEYAKSQEEHDALIEYWIDVLRKLPVSAYKDYFPNMPVKKVMKKTLTDNESRGAANILRFLEGVKAQDPKTLEEFDSYLTRRQSPLGLPDSDSDDDHSDLVVGPETASSSGPPASSLPPVSSLAPASSETQLVQSQSKIHGRISHFEALAQQQKEQADRDRAAEVSRRQASVHARLQRQNTGAGG